MKTSLLSNVSLHHHDLNIISMSVILRAYYMHFYLEKMCNTQRRVRRHQKSECPSYTYVNYACVYTDNILGKIHEKRLRRFLKVKTWAEIRARTEGKNAA